MSKENNKGFGMFVRKASGSHQICTRVSSESAMAPTLNTKLQQSFIKGVVKVYDDMGMDANKLNTFVCVPFEMKDGTRVYDWNSTLCNGWDETSSGLTYYPKTREKY